MIAADDAVQRPPDAKLLVLGPTGEIAHIPRSRFVDLLRAGDLVIANDAATLPASLHGVHEPTGAPIEVRLAAWAGPLAQDVTTFRAVVFGAGDFHTRTEDRGAPPPLAPGDRPRLGPLASVVVVVGSHPRLVTLRLDGAPDHIWAGLARHGRPIQYAHLRTPLAIWDVWTPIAGLPAAFEAPSASFALDWHAVETMRARGLGFATLTHAAGISSTGDAALDRLLPFDEPYLVPHVTAAAIHDARRRGGRIVAVGTTVVRALEHAAGRDGHVVAGPAIADNRIGTSTPVRCATQSCRARTSRTRATTTGCARS